MNALIFAQIEAERAVAMRHSAERREWTDLKMRHERMKAAKDSGKPCDDIYLPPLGPEPSIPARPTPLGSAPQPSSIHIMACLIIMALSTIVIAHYVHSSVAIIMFSTTCVLSVVSNEEKKKIENKDLEDKVAKALRMSDKLAKAYIGGVKAYIESHSA
jgi:hypothetical protein